MLTYSLREKSGAKFDCIDSSSICHSYFHWTKEKTVKLFCVSFRLKICRDSLSCPQEKERARTSIDLVWVKQSNNLTCCAECDVYFFIIIRCLLWDLLLSVVYSKWFRLYTLQVYCFNNRVMLCTVCEALELFLSIYLLSPPMTTENSTSFSPSQAAQTRWVLPCPARVQRWLPPGEN